MNAHYRMTALAAILAGTALFGAGCSDRTPADRTASNTPAAPSTTAPSTIAPSTTAPSTSSAASSDTNRTATEVVSDAAITGKVKAAVMAEPGIRSLKIDVDTKDGIVTLNGKVDSQEHKERAMQVAQNVNGVKSVVDNLSVSAS